MLIEMLIAYSQFSKLNGAVDDNLPDEQGRGVHVPRESSPSPVGSNYTTASESEKQTLNDVMNPNYDEKLNSAQQPSNENIVPQTINNEKSLQVDQQQRSTPTIQCQASSASSVSTVAGNDVVTTHPSGNPADLSDSTKVVVPAANNLEANSGKQENNSAPLATSTSSSKVSNITLYNCLLCTMQQES